MECWHCRSQLHFRLFGGVTFMQVKNFRYPLMLGRTEHAWECITYGKATHVSPLGRISIGILISKYINGTTISKHCMQTITTQYGKAPECGSNQAASINEWFPHPVQVC